MDSTTHATSVADPRDRKKFYFADRPKCRALVGFARSVFKLVMELEVVGLENFPSQGAVILAANHVTNFDVVPMQFALPRPIFFIGKAELFRNPVMDIFLRNLSGFPVNRGEKDLWAMRHATEVLNHVQTLGMFPQGKRSKGKGLAQALPKKRRGVCAEVPKGFEM